MYNINDHLYNVLMIILVVNLLLIQMNVKHIHFVWTKDVYEVNFILCLMSLYIWLILKVFRCHSYLERLDLNDSVGFLKNKLIVRF